MGHFLFKNIISAAEVTLIEPPLSFNAQHQMQTWRRPHPLTHITFKRMDVVEYHIVYWRKGSIYFATRGSELEEPCGKPDWNFVVLCASSCVNAYTWVPIKTITWYSRFCLYKSVFRFFIVVLVIDWQWHNDNWLRNAYNLLAKLRTLAWKLFSQVLESSLSNRRIFFVKQHLCPAKIESWMTKRVYYYTL